MKGVLVDGGPDHYARLEAVKLFISWFLHGGDNAVPAATGRERVARRSCGQHRVAVPNRGAAKGAFQGAIRDLVTEAAALNADDDRSCRLMDVRSFVIRQ